VSFRPAPSYDVTVRAFLVVLAFGAVAASAAAARVPDSHDRVLIAQLEAKVQAYEGLGSSSSGADSAVKRCAFVKNDPAKAFSAAFALLPVEVIQAVTKWRGPFRDIQHTLVSMRPHDDLFRRWVVAERSEVAFLLRFDNGGKTIDVCKAAQLLMEKRPSPTEIRAVLGIDPSLVGTAFVRATAKSPLSKLNPPMRAFFIAGGVSKKHAVALTT
jgi:hypothetical protein